MPDSPPAHASAGPDPDLLRAEAARYALLRRLSPALRHEAAAPLQPIAMAASVLEKRLSAPTPALDPVRESVQRLVAYARKAAQGGLDLVAWLAPDRRARQALDAAVEEALALLSTPLGFEGFTLQAGLDPRWAGAPVPTAAMRLLLPACLLWLTDQARAPATLQIAMAGGTPPRLRMTLAQASESGPGQGTREPAYRRLGAAEVMALARSEGLVLALAEDALELDLPLPSAPDL